MREGGLLAWQWRHYPEGHQDRGNLLLHILTVPLFLTGTVGVVSAVLALQPLWAAPGLVGMGLAAGLQGRGHRRERNAPLPFEGPLDVVVRIFFEQWITFPRFVLSGGFARAWREAKGVTS
jgi:hypothetical protein